MPTLASIIENYSPPNGSVGVPLSSTIIINFSCLMDEDSLEEQFFVEGPDTDQFVGSGVAEFHTYPDNVSQGDDFLESPGYAGIVQGTIVITTVSGKSVLTFTPTNPMAALTLYTAHLPEADDSGGTNYTGHITFSWTTGSGSIEVLPDTASTSVLTSLVSSLSSLTALEVVKTIPEDLSADNEITLETIEIEFNKYIHPASLADNITVKTYSATDHPSATATAIGDLATAVTVEGKKIKIRI